MNKNTMLHSNNFADFARDFRNFLQIQENRRALESLKSVSYAPERGTCFVGAYYRADGTEVKSHTRMIYAGKVR